MKFLINHIKQDMKLFLLLIFNLVLLAFFAPFRNFYIQKIIDSESFNILLSNVVVVIGLCIGVFLLESFSNITQSKSIQKLNLKIRSEVFNKIISTNINSFRGNNIADYMSNLTTDIKMITDDYFNAIFEIILYSGFILSSITMLASIHIGLLVIVLFQSIIVIILPKLIGSKLQILKGNLSNTIGKYMSRTKDFFSGFEVIKTFNIESKVRSGHDQINLSLAESEYKFSKTNLLGQATSSFINYIFFVLITSCSMYLLLSDKITFGMMIAATQMMIFITTPAAIISRNLIRIKSTKSIIDKIDKIINTEKNNDGNLIISKFESNITFENVSFSYNNDITVLNDVSINFEKGKKYAIVGTSGSGKSTLVKLILKYYSSYAGNIKVDDNEISDISTDSFYNICQTIHQNIFLFNDSIKNNICLYGEFTENELNEAMKKSGLLDVISRSQFNLENIVSEDGTNFSGGERQRIAIARALIRKPSIIILDEATSSLDNETAYLIEDDLLKIDELTLIVVTHKYNKNTLKKYDKIICLKDGKVVESGNFDELMNNKDYFYGLYSIQM